MDKIKIRRIHEFLPELKDYYTITSDGEVYSDNSGKMKTRNKPGTEYQIINFSTNDGKKRTFRLHRLVMLAFNPIDNANEMEVNHIDGNKLNNKLSNLEWCTTSENQKHAYKIGLSKARKGEASNFSKLKKKDIEMIYELKKNNLTNAKIAEIVNCTPSNISHILRGKSWQV